MKGMLLVTFGAEARSGRIDNVPAEAWIFQRTLFKDART
jgi:hypothetical protein